MDGSMHTIELGPSVDTESLPWAVPECSDAAEDKFADSCPYSLGPDDALAGVAALTPLTGSR